MEDELKLINRKIAISGERSMNFYTFELDGVPMSEMKKEDVIETFDSEQAEKPQG